MKLKYAVRRWMIPAAVFLSLWFCGFSLTVLLKRGGQAFVILGQMFPPDLSYASKVLRPLAVTVQMSVGGSFLGALLALPVGALACQRVTGKKGMAVVIRAAVSVVRAVPVLVAALAASFIFGTGALAGTAAIAFFTFGIVARMTWEKLDHLDFTAYEALQALGNGRPGAFRHAIWPELFPVYLSDSLYALEINIRHASILGYVGAGGIGLLLNEKIAWREYARTGMILLMLFAVVLFVEQIGEYLRLRLRHPECMTVSFKWVTMIAALVMIVWSLSGLQWQGLSEKGGIILAGIADGLLHPDWSLIFNLTKNGIPWLLLETLCIAVGGTAIGALLALPAAIIGSYAVSPGLPAFCMRILAAAVRTLPSMIAGLIFVRVTGPGAFAGVMTMALLSFGMCCRMFMNTLDQTDRELLDVFRAMGCGWTARVRHAVWPECRKALTADVWYRLDVNLRDASVLGFVGAGGIGAPLLFAMNGYSWDMAAAYLLGLLILVLAADRFSAKMSKR